MTIGGVQAGVLWTRDEIKLPCQKLTIEDQHPGVYGKVGTLGVIVCMR